MTFFWPWFLLLLPLPLLIIWLKNISGLNHSETSFNDAIRLPGYEEVEELSLSNNQFKFWHYRILLPFIIWSLLVVSIAQPLWLDDNKKVPISGRDLMLLIDASGSMRQMDFARLNIPHSNQFKSKTLSSQKIDTVDYTSISRLELVKQLAGFFIKKRTGDRVGLILFGDRPYLRAGLSFDLRAIEQLIYESEIALAGESTAIGDAIGLAIKRMKNLPSQSRVIVLLTDGGNNEGMVSPIKAAQIAKSMGIRIYTIGIGKASHPGPNPYGVWSSENAQRFEESVLTEIAETTGGHYFYALDSKGLQTAYQQLDRLEPALHPDIQKQLAYALYPWTLTAALLLSIWGMFTNRLPQLEPISNG